MNNQVICSECNELTKVPQPKRAVHKDLVYEYYWHCSSCNHKHIAYYTDKKIRRDINRQKKRWKKYQQTGTESSERKLLAEINMEDKLIEKDMGLLKEKMKTLT